LEEFTEIWMRKFLTRKAISSKCFCATTQQSLFQFSRQQQLPVIQEIAGKFWKLDKTLPHARRGKGLTL
jgi:hypothetical protein